MTAADTNWQDRQRQEAGIRAGNPPSDGSTPPTDKSMRPKEYWETRVSPAKPHHWTRDEFEQHLLAHRFPANTIRDRMQHHTVTIRDALVRGEYVPAEVMADAGGKEAVQDAIQLVGAMAYATNAMERQKANSLELEVGMGNSPKDLLRAILYLAAKAPLVPDNGKGMFPWPAGGYKEVQSLCYPHPLHVCNRTMSSQEAIHIQDGRYEPNSLFAGLHTVPMVDAARLYKALLDANEVSAVEVASVLGAKGMGYLPRACVLAL